MLFKVKTVLKEDIRLFKREVKDFADAYEALKAFIKEAYPINDAPFSIQYQDEENDLITIGTPEDLKEAFEQAQEANRALKLHVVLENASRKAENKSKEAEKKEDEATDEGESSQESSDEEQTPLNPWQQLLQDLANNEEFRAEFVNFLTTFVVSLQEGMQGAANEAFKQSLSAHERVQQHPAVAKLAEKFPSLMDQFPMGVAMVSGLDAEKIGDYVNVLVQMSSGMMHPDGSNQLPPWMATFVMPYLMNMFGHGRFPPHHPPHPFHHPPHHGPHGPHGHPHHPPHHGPPPFGAPPMFGLFGCPPPAPPECGFFGGERKCGKWKRGGGGRCGRKKWARWQAWVEQQKQAAQEQGQGQEKQENENANENANAPFMGPFGGPFCGGRRGWRGCHGRRWKQQGDQDGEFAADVVRDDITVEHRGYVMPGAVIKTWLVKNTGKQDFPEGVKVKYCGPPFNPLVDGVEFDVQPLKTGEEGEVTVMVKAPQEGGLYRSRWRLFLPTGAPFGEILKCHVQVVEDESAPNANQEAQVNEEKYENENAHFAVAVDEPAKKDAKPVLESCWTHTDPTTGEEARLHRKDDDEKALKKEAKRLAALEKQQAKLEAQKAKVEKKIAKEKAKADKEAKRLAKEQQKKEKEEKKQKKAEKAAAAAAASPPKEADSESNPSFVHVEAMEVDEDEVDGADEAMELDSEVEEMAESDKPPKDFPEGPAAPEVPEVDLLDILEPVVVEEEAEPFEFQAQLESIMSMGVEDSDAVRALLVAHKGDVNVVVNALFNQQ